MHKNAPIRQINQKQQQGGWREKIANDEKEM